MNRKMLIAIVVVAVLGLGGLVGYPMVKQAILESDPVNHIMYSGLLMEDQKAVDATWVVTFSLDEEKMVEQGIFNESEDPKALAAFVNTFLKRMSLEYNILSKVDYEADDLQISLDLGLLYKDIPALELGADFKQWEASIESPQIIDSPLHFNIQDALDASGTEVQLKDVNLSAYLKAIYEKDEAYNKVLNNLKNYEPVFRNLLEGKVEKLGKSKVAIEVNGAESEVGVVQYKLNLSMDDIYDMYIELGKIARTDEDMSAFILDRVNKIEALIVENEDYAMFGFEKEEVTTGFDEIRTKITVEWEATVEEFITIFESQKDMVNTLAIEQELSNTVISIDKKNIVRQVSVEVLSEGFTLNETVTYNAFGDDVVMPEILTSEDNRDIFEIVSDETKMMTLKEEVTTNLSSKLLGGEAVTAILSDVKTDVELLPEGEREAMVQQFEESISGMQMMLPFMLSGMGM